MFGTETSGACVLVFAEETVEEEDIAELGPDRPSTPSADEFYSARSARVFPALLPSVVSHNSCLSVICTLQQEHSQRLFAVCNMNSSHNTGPNLNCAMHAVSGTQKDEQAAAVAAVLFLLQCNAMIKGQ